MNVRQKTSELSNTSKTKKTHQMKTDKFVNFNSDTFFAVIDGFFRRVEKSCHVTIPRDIKQIIKFFAWPVSQQSRKNIVATDLIATLIQNYINDNKNKCPCLANDELNILKHIYLRGNFLNEQYLLKHTDCNNIDIIIDVDQLSTVFLNHLTKYHSKNGNVNNKDGCSQCFLWQKYLNKYNDKVNKNNKSSILQKRKKERNFDKIWDFEQYIECCNYIINGDFIVNEMILSQLKRNKYDYKYIGNNHRIRIDNIKYKTFDLTNINFNICDSSKSKYLSMIYSIYDYFHGLNKHSMNDNDYFLAIAKIEQFELFDKSLNSIDRDIDINIPIHPIETNVTIHDFATRSLHIDLNCVLNNGTNMNRIMQMHNNKEIIDVNWRNKIEVFTNNCNNNNGISQWNKCIMQQFEDKSSKRTLMVAIEKQKKNSKKTRRKGNDTVGVIDNGYASIANCGDINAIINIQIGQCGNQICHAFWHSLIQEYSLQYDGTFTGISQNNLINYRKRVRYAHATKKANSIGVYFSETKNFQYRARCIFIDNDAIVLDTVRSSPLSRLFENDNCIITQDDIDIDTIMDKTRQECEKCHFFQGFQVCHPVSGNSSSKLTNILLTEINDYYPDRIAATFSILPNINSTSDYNNYNTILSMNKLIECAHETFIIDNDALYKMSQEHLKETNPTYCDLASYFLFFCL